MKFLFELFTSPLGLPIPWYIEYLILFVVNIFAYEFAYSTVGKLYSGSIIHGRKTGSILHWIIRIFSFLVVWAVLYLLIYLAKLCIAHWVIVVSVAGGVFGISIITFVIVKIFKKKT